MTKKPEPVVLELAPLPREQVGPFLILGLDKDAGKEQIEANWAERVKWARKGQTRLALEDINWAREALRDPDKRVGADAASLNVETSDGALRDVAQRYLPGGKSGLLWQPLDVEKPLADYTPAAEVPDPRELLSALAVPEVPREAPMVAELLDRLAQEPLDPWSLSLPPP